MNPTFGMEEEVFIVEPTKPSVQSLYYLSKLVRNNPKRHLKHTDSNFSRKKDILQGLMSGVEISTFVNNNAPSLVADLKQRRTELNDVSEGLIVPLGHLINFETPSNTCALQFHIGNLDNPERIYSNLVHFLPLLFLLAANSPSVAGNYFGKSWRLLHSYAVGPLQEDWTVRFQDIIFAKRTGTIELRCFDPIWDLKRIYELAKAIECIVNLDHNYELDIEKYNSLRADVAVNGFTEKLEPLYEEFNAFCGIKKCFFKVTPADIVWKHYLKHGLEDTYSALDYGYMNNKLKVSEVEPRKKNLAKMITGFATYYIPKLPYDLWKYLQEH